MARPADPMVREQILEAAFKLFSHYSFKKTTIDDIANEAGIAKGSVYLHFKNKLEIIHSVGLKYAAAHINSMRAFLQNIESAEERLCIVIKKRSLKAHFLMQDVCHADEVMGWSSVESGSLEPIPESLVKLFLDLLKDVLLYGKSQGVFHFDDVEFMAQHINLMSLALMPPYRKCWQLEELEKHLDYYCFSVIKMLKSKEEVSSYKVEKQPENLEGEK